MTKVNNPYSTTCATCQASVKKWLDELVASGDVTAHAQLKAQIETLRATEGGIDKLDKLDPGFAAVLACVEDVLQELPKPPKPQNLFLDETNDPLSIAGGAAPAMKPAPAPSPPPVAAPPAPTPAPPAPAPAPPTLSPFPVHLASIAARLPTGVDITPLAAFLSDPSVAVDFADILSGIKPDAPTLARLTEALSRHPEAQALVHFSHRSRAQRRFRKMVGRATF